MSSASAILPARNMYLAHLELMYRSAMSSDCASSNQRTASLISPACYHTQQSAHWCHQRAITRSSQLIDITSVLSHAAVSSLMSPACYHTQQSAHWCHQRAITHSSQLTDVTSVLSHTACYHTQQSAHVTLKHNKQSRAVHIKSTFNRIAIQYQMCCGHLYAGKQNSNYV